MSLSNKAGSLVLTTGNKSELAVGYCTLYGDMAGGFAVIRDVPKTLVYALCPLAQRRRRGHPPVGAGQAPVGRAAPRPARHRLAAALRGPRPDPRGLRRGRRQPRRAGRQAASTATPWPRSSAWSTGPSTSAARPRPAPRSPAAPSARTAACPSPTASAAPPGRPGQEGRMAFIETIPEDEAEGATAEWYAADLARTATSQLHQGVRAPAGGLRRLAAAGRRHRRRHGPAPLRAGHRGRGQGAALQLLLAGPRQGPGRAGSSAPSGRLALADGAVDTPSTRPDAEIVRFATLVTRERRRGHGQGRRAAAGRSGCPTRRSSTSSWPWPPAASSAPSSRPSASSPTRPSRRSTRTCGRP